MQIYPRSSNLIHFWRFMPETAIQLIIHTTAPSCLTFLPYFALLCHILPSCHILPYFAILCLTLPYLTFLPSYHILPSFALICHILPYLAISYLTLPYLAFLPHLFHISPSWINPSVAFKLFRSVLWTASNCFRTDPEIHPDITISAVWWSAGCKLPV